MVAQETRRYFFCKAAHKILMKERKLERGHNSLLPNTKNDTNSWFPPGSPGNWISCWTVRNKSWHLKVILCWGLSGCVG